MKNISHKYLLILCALIVCSLEIYAQKSYNLKIIANENQKSILKKYSYKKEFNDTITLNSELNNLIYTLWRDGYMAASFDSIVKKPEELQAYINTGKKYLWIKLKKGNVENALLQEAGYKEN
ncbi:MAG: hypothetical protein HGB12_09435, partial [Bacteroidetes bacterium]|nr:hypothetical protein [Bacteroidota bacterium]